jgi:resuscitation-promoting factor RpfA
MAVLVPPATALHSLRRRLAGLAVLAAMAGASGPALAQLDDYGGGYARYGYGYDYDDDYRPRYDYAPRRAAPIPPRAVERIAVQEFGLREVQRTVRTRSAIVVDGVTANGSRVRLLIDRFSGELIDRIVLQPPQRTVRLDPREEERPAPKKLIPRPPERPAALKPAQPPAEANAPATAVPPSPAVPKPDAAPVKPAAVPSVVKDIGKPKLVNPQDVRGSDEPDRLPPLARAHPSGIPVPDTTVPPVTVVP